MNTILTVYLNSGARQMSNKKAISLFSGAGGMDVGFMEAGFQIQWANDFDKDACATYRHNIGDHVVHGDIDELLNELNQFDDIDCLFGGPPCQGFSVAGRMDPNDDRSKLVFSFMEAVRLVKPKVFVMENVKALGTLSKFQLVREEIIKKAEELGYKTELMILNSKDFGVPQARERMFIVGYNSQSPNLCLSQKIQKFHEASPTVREIIKPLGPAGSENNNKTVNAKISIAKSPVLRKSPYAGMLFNGQGRPLKLDSYSSTLHASMGGNRTPIIDEKQLYDDEPAWIEEYHAHLMAGGEPLDFDKAPKRLRRMTIDEAHLLQTFPPSYEFIGRQSSVFKQIGNAVPCNLARAVGRLVVSILENKNDTVEMPVNQSYELAFG